MQIRIRQGKGGKWRWHLYMGDIWQGMGRAYSDALECERAARVAFMMPIELHLSSGNVQNGRSRDIA